MSNRSPAAWFVAAVHQVFGFLVPYFDREVIRFGTPPYKEVSMFSSRLQVFDIPNPTLLAPNGISHQDNPGHDLPLLRPPNAAAHCDLNVNQQRQHEV